MALYRKAVDVPVGTVDMGTTSFSTTLIHGTSASLMLAERPAGYHSRPHTHQCEQLNLLQAGELHVYCDGRAVLLERGDVLRIPPGTVHWSWNKAQVPCTLIEVHAPGLQSDPEIAPFAVGLFDDGEDPQPVARPRNEAVELSHDEVLRVEASPPVNQAPTPAAPAAERSPRFA